MTVAKASDLIGINAGSPTTLIASVNGAATTVYTPSHSVEIALTGQLTTGGSCTVNGVLIFNSPGFFTFSFYAGTGQTITMVTTVGTGVLISSKRLD